MPRHWNQVLRASTVGNRPERARVNGSTKAPFETTSSVRCRRISPNNFARCMRRQVSGLSPTFAKRWHEPDLPTGKASAAGARLW